MSTYGIEYFLFIHKTDNILSNTFNTIFDLIII